MISVVVADDHAVVRTGLQLIFNESTGIAVVAEADNGNDLLSLLKENSFDVAIIDVNMPGLNSLELISEIRRVKPALPLVIFTMNPDEKLAARMFKNGALAYINKEEDPEELINAVKNVVNNKRYLTKRQEYFFATRFIMGDEEKNELENLTDREFQILCLLAEGVPNSDIAQKLDISKNTISNHRNNILKKLSLVNNAELTKYALNHQLIQ